MNHLDSRLAVVLVVVGLAGCTVALPEGPPSAEVPIEPARVTRAVEWTVAPSARQPDGTVATLFTMTLLASPPANFTGVLVEFVPDVPAAPPALVHRFGARADGEPVFSTSTPEDGVYRGIVEPTAWARGKLTVSYAAGTDGLPAGASAATKVDVYVTTFYGPPEWAYSAPK